MVHTNLVSAVAANSRTHSSGSFHAGAPIPEIGSISTPRRSSMRRQSSHGYHTFPTPPPKTPRGVDEAVSSSGSSASSSSADGVPHDAHEHTPLPVRQLGLLAFLSLAEQTALNSISPYLPSMIESFPEIPSSQTGLYVGLLASAFALAQLSTNLLWGYLSDMIGRKPVMLLGTFLLMVCFGFFGFCTTYWHVIVVHVAMGMLNGNAAVVPTVLGELTDRSNQSEAFTWLPVIYSLGGITGPALGGLLVGTLSDVYPYLAPNAISAALLLCAVIVVGILFEETLESEDKWDVVESVVDHMPSLLRPRRPSSSWSARWPRRGSDALRSRASSTSSASSSEAAAERDALLITSTENVTDGAVDQKDHEERSPWHDLLNPRTILLLSTYLIFQLSNISFNSLYPIFASAAPPTGRKLSPRTIGITLSIAGAATILFQIFAFQPLKARLGNLGTYRYALLGLSVSMALMPWVGYLDDKPAWGLSGKEWLHVEVTTVLMLKSLAAVGGLSCVMLLITNSAPSHASLGTLQGLAQTLSAAGRSVGPFLSGGLFTLATQVQSKGEALAWGLFGGIALVGFISTFFLRGDGLESDDWIGEHEPDEVPRHEES